jgi:hypothetical protein
MLAGALHNQRAALKEGVIDLHVTMDLPGIALLDFERVRAVARAGYESARPAIEQWASEQRWMRAPA